MSPPPNAARASIRRKFALTLAAVTAAVALAGLAAVLLVRGAIRDDVRRSQESVANLETARVALQLDLSGQRVGSSAAVRALGPATRRALGDGPRARAALGAELRALPQRVPGVVAASVIAGDGRVVAVSTRPDGSQRPRRFDDATVARIRARLAAGRNAVVGPAFPARTGGRYLQAMAVRDEGRLEAVLMIEPALAPVERIIAAHGGVGDTADAHLVQLRDGAGQYITAPRFAPERRWSRFALDDRGFPAVRALTTGDGYSADARDLDGRSVVAAVRRVPGTEWALVATREAGEAFALTRTVAFIVIGTLALAVLASALAIVLVARSVRRRIRRITASAQAISRGDLQVRIRDSSDDELGVLADTFDRMADTLARDVARRREVEVQLEHQARHDPLTGLPNRATLETRLATMMGGGRGGRGGGAPGGAGVAVLFCDMDEFKAVNDALGHRAGDELLRVVAERLRAALRPGDTLTRFGGDEFVAVCGIVSPGEAEIVAARLQGAVRDPVVIDGHEVSVSLSIGIAIGAADATPESLIRDADVAMYVAKNAGRRRHVVYDESMRVGAASPGSADELRRAIADGALTLEYQPIVLLDSGRVTSVEALVRWRRNGEAVPAAEWVPRAEELGVAGELDRWVVERACRQVARWRSRTETPDLSLSVNLCTDTLRDAGFAGEALRAARTAGLPPEALCVEVRSRAFSDTSDATLANLRRLREAGARVAIDDFGAELGTLSRLGDLPADIVKLDAALIGDVDRDPVGRDAAAAVIELARSVPVRAVAEGIEREAQRDVLVGLGCPAGQGFHLGRPEPPQGVTV